MEIEIIEAPIGFHLYGLSSSVPNNSFGEVGMKLMNEMWRIVKESQAGTTGINHWVYLPDNRMFVGVKLLPDTRLPELLKPMALTPMRWREST